MKKMIPLLLLATLAGCTDNTEPPTRVCDKRETVSGICTDSRFVCPSPMKMFRLYGGPICSMDDPTMLHPRIEKAE